MESEAFSVMGLDGGVSGMTICSMEVLVNEKSFGGVTESISSGDD